MSKPDVQIFLEELEKLDPGVKKEELNVIPVEKISKPDEIIKPEPEAIISTRIYIDYIYLQELKDNDYNLDSYTMIDLSRNKDDIKISDGYYFILFTNESKMGREYLQRWLELAKVTKNDYCKMAYTNLTFEKKILNNFKSLGNIEHLYHPYNWAKFIEVPFMLVYKNHWPVGFYNGETNQASLLKFIIEDIYENLKPIEKKHTKRKDIREMIEGKNQSVEKNIKVETIKQRAIESDRKKKENIKKINPKTQEILSDINYLDN